MKLRDNKKFWDLYRFTGDFFAIDMKTDASEKFGDFLEGEIIAELTPAADENFRLGWIIRKASDGLPYLISFYEQMDYLSIITARVELLK
ncbi:MAG: hypothetical protein EAX96_17585 [Candidatus Lokiarchaeota archaeon]|nr:hypothetical protein [Candidatus Lokiarchaeota archaeon]